MKNRVKFVFLVLSALSLGLAGCGKGDSADSTIRTSQFSDAQGGCPNGGIKIEVLVDDVVDESQTVYTCNGARGQVDNTDIRTTRFADAHGNCPYGGVMIEVLKNGEVQADQTQYICDGAAGRDGQDGQKSHDALVTTSEDVGNLCNNGGMRMDAGLDANDNGELEAEEILSTRYVCNGVSGKDGTNGRDAGIQTTYFSDAQGGCENGGVIVVVLIDGKVVEGQTQYICNGAAGQDGRDGQNGHEAIVATSENVGENCAHGGIRVDSGLDLDDDGELAGNEIRGTRYICNGEDGENGAAGADAGIRTTKFDDAQGGCKNGGVKVEVLMGNEVQNDLTQYICNGTNGLDGQAGQNGHAALVSASEDADDYCAHGGIRVDTGLDLDDDGELAENEIRGTRYVCNGEDGVSGAAGVDADIRTTKFDDAQGGCKSGGVKVEVWMNDEVVEGQTQYICNGADGSDGLAGQNGHAALVATSEDVDDYCAHGGIRVNIGLDLDDDGALSEKEIRSFRYICNGEDGQNGTNGTNARIQTTKFDDAQGGCKNGGVMVEVLIENEVQDDLTQYICNGADGVIGQ